MRFSEQVNEISKALCEVQGKLSGAKRSSENPHFKSKYADLSSVWDACREPLHEAGIAAFQGHEPMGLDSICMVTRLVHGASGQWVESRLEIPVSKRDAQGFGSATTYARRFALSAMVGICPEDDDGNDAVGSPKPLRGPMPNKSLETQLRESVTVNDVKLAILNAKSLGELNEAKLLMSNIPVQLRTELVELGRKKRQELSAEVVRGVNP